MTAVGAKDEDSLYAVASVEHRWVKVGRARCVHTRLVQLQAYCWDRLRIAAEAAGAGRREMAVQWFLRDHWSHGEWYRPGALAIIESIGDFGAWSKAVVKQVRAEVGSLGNHSMMRALMREHQLKAAR